MPASARISAVVYVAVAAAMGHRLLAAPGSVIAHDVGDPLLNAAILVWNARTIPWTDAWYQFPIYFPASDALTFSEHLLGVSAIASPIYWVTHNGLTTYNLTLWLSYPLCALAMFALVWRLTRSGPAAFLAGLAFGFAPYRAAQLPHIQVLIVFWAPLALLGLHAYFETRRLRWLALFAAAWMLQGAANGYFLVYFSIVVGAWILWFGVAARRWREVAMTAVALALGALPLLPILYRYWVTHHRYGFSWGPEVVRTFAADITSPACPVAGLSLWGWLGGNCGPESELFLGPTLAVLSVVSVWSVVRSERGHAMRFERTLTCVSRALMLLSVPFLAGGVWFTYHGPWVFELGPLTVTGSTAAKPFTNGVLLLLAGLLTSRTFRVLSTLHTAAAFYLTMAIVAWAMTWGPLPQLRDATVLQHGPYALVQLLPGMDGLRAPARFWMMTVLCLCVLVGLLCAPWLRRRSPVTAGAIVVAAAVGIVLDGWMPMPAPTPPIPELTPMPSPGQPVMVLPIRWNDQSAEFRAVAGGWPSINGASGHQPLFYGWLKESSDEYDPALFEPFLMRGDLHVIVYTGSQLVEVVERQPGVVEIGRSRDFVQYRIPRRGRPALEFPMGEPLRIAALSASCGEERLAEVTDGNVDTRWHCLVQDKDAEFKVDLGTIARVGAVTAAIGPFRNDFPRQLVVETSPDGERWDHAWTGSGLAATLEAEALNVSAEPVTVSFAPRPARFVRLRQTGRHDIWWWSIAEIQVRAGGS